MAKATDEETHDVMEWLADWDVKNICPELEKVMLHIDDMRKNRKDIFFAARRRAGREMDAMPASFFRSTLLENADGKRPVDWNFGVSFRDEWDFGKKVVNGPVIQLNTFWKDSTKGHKFTSYFKNNFLSRDDLRKAPLLLSMEGVTSEWPGKGSWRKWEKESQIVIFAKEFKDLHKHMIRAIEVIDNTIPKGKS